MPDDPDTKPRLSLEGADAWSALLLGFIHVLYAWAIFSTVTALWPKASLDEGSVTLIEARAAKSELAARQLADSVRKDSTAAQAAKNDSTLIRRLAANHATLARLQADAGALRYLADSLQTAMTLRAVQPTDVKLLRGLVSLPGLTLDVRLILLAMAIGALGSFIHMAHSFVTFVGNQTFRASWTWWYLLRPLIGSALAAILYFVVRGALFPTGLGASVDVNPFGVASLAALAGMFSKQATDKLSEVFDTLFRTSPRAGDAQRTDKLAPALKIDTAQAKRNGTVVTITVAGVGFVQGSQVKVEGKPITTSYVSATQLTATMADSALPTTKTTVTILVENPRTPAGTPTSNAVEAPVT